MLYFSLQQYHNNRCLGESGILVSARQSLRCSPPPDQHTPCDPQMSSNRQKKCFHVKLCNTTTKTKTSQFAAGEDCYKYHNLFFCPNDACCLTVTGDSATWLHPLPALTSAAYLDAPRSTHAHLRFAGSACAGPHRDATV